MSVQDACDSHSEHTRSPLPRTTLGAAPVRVFHALSFPTSPPYPQGRRRHKEEKEEEGKGGRGAQWLATTPDPHAATIPSCFKDARRRNGVSTTDPSTHLSPRRPPAAIRRRPC